MGLSSVGTSGSAIFSAFEDSAFAFVLEALRRVVTIVIEVEAEFEFSTDCQTVVKLNFPKISMPVHGPWDSYGSYSRASLLRMAARISSRRSEKRSSKGGLRVFLCVRSVIYL